MDFEKVCMMFTMQEPYYGILLSSMNRFPVSESVCKTIGVGRSGNTFRLVYNPEFIGKLDVDTILEVLKHECLHLALGHFGLWETEPDSEDEQFIRNLAGDLEVNCYVDTGKMKGVNPATVDKFGFKPRLGTREYYSKIIDTINRIQQKANANQPQKPCNGGTSSQQQQSSSQNKPSQQNQQQPGQSQSSNGQQSQQGQQGQDNQSNNGNQNGQGGGPPSSNTPKVPDSMKTGYDEIDDHSQWPDKMSDSEKEVLQQQIEDMLVFAADEIEKSCGSVPGELVGRIELIRNRRKPKPVADWKRYVRRYLGNEFSEFVKKSKKRESKRFPDAAGNRHRRKSNILVAIDTSGSVSMPEYQEFFGQIQTLTSTANFEVIECDASIQHKYIYNGKPNMILHGGGGTSFQPVVDYFNERRMLFDALIYFTDGECSVPSDTPKDTLWVISSKGDHSDRKRFQVNGASVVFIPENK